MSVSSEAPEPSLTATLYGSIADLALMHRGRGAEADLLKLAYRDGTYPPFRKHVSPRTVEDAVMWRDHVVLSVLLRDETARVSERLGGLNIDHVILKGAPLGVQLQGGVRERQSTDIDLLVRPEEVFEVIGLLGDLGYLPPPRPSLKPWAMNQVLLEHAGSGIHLELHWWLMRPDEFPGRLAPDWSRVRRQDMGGVEIPVLGRQDLLLNLLLHSVQHRGALKTIGDLCAWIDYYGLDEFERTRREIMPMIDGREVFLWPLKTLDFLCGTRLCPTSSRLVSWLAIRAGLRVLTVYFGKADTRTIYLHRPSTTLEQLDALGISMLQRGMGPGGLSPLEALGPVLIGPHRVGRRLMNLAERTGLLRREALVTHTPLQHARERLMGFLKDERGRLRRFGAMT